ncbi:E3 ubiquitin-protein ligase ORTHRUS 2 [Ancistrocladus abbreviatus]
MSTAVEAHPASARQLPCDADGNCMLCGKNPPEAEKLFCKTCVTPWHVECLAVPPQSLASTAQWECPDCSELAIGVAVGGLGSDVATKSAAPPVLSGADGELVAAIRSIEADGSLTEEEKARKRQKLLSGNADCGSDDAEEEIGKEKTKDDNEILAILGENMKCSFCMQLPDRPVTTPCGHNFCLKCFERWLKQGKKACAKCRKKIPDKMLHQPRINSSLVYAIRMARLPIAAPVGAPRVMQFVHNEDLPDKAFTTERAKKAGKANAKSGRIFVTIPNDHLGPIPAENDPIRKVGVLVGDSWEDRFACRQWGAHFPHVSGIAGQATYGAQSVVLSGGYVDDEDHGEWFLYTGSGGRDLSGNKRTNKEQASDQTFTLGNEALRYSCKRGYPVRVVRSHKEKRSNYAPEKGLRYDGIYRIEKCWRKVGKQGYKVCRYLFVRCEDSPAPWSSDGHGDRPRDLPKVKELAVATDITERKENPHWDFDVDEGCWKWKKPPPPSRLGVKGIKLSRKRRSSKKSHKEKILKGLSCLICHKVMTLPITTPCAHNFCKSCLDGAFAGQTFVTERSTGGRQLRTRKNIMKCPSCTTDISEFLQTAQVNRELMGAIESLKQTLEEDDRSSETSEEVSGAGSEDATSEGTEISASESGETESKPRTSKPRKTSRQNTAEEKPNEDGDGGDEALEAEAAAVTKRGAGGSKAGGQKFQRGNKSDSSSEASEENSGTGSENAVSVGAEIGRSESNETTSKARATRGRKKKTVEEKPGGLNAGENKAVEAAAATKQGAKRKKGGAAGVGVKTRGHKAQRGERSNSPSSPLNVRTDDDLE